MRRVIHNCRDLAQFSSGPVKPVAVPFPHGKDEDGGGDYGALLVSGPRAQPGRRTRELPALKWRTILGRPSHSRHPEEER